MADAALADAVGVLVDNAFDMCFIFSNSATFKLQGSSDGGSTYNDLAGTSMTCAALTDVGMMSVTRAVGIDHIKAVLTGTGHWCVAVRRMIRQSPIVPTPNSTLLRRQVITPAYGTP